MLIVGSDVPLEQSAPALYSTFTFTVSLSSASSISIEISTFPLPSVFSETEFILTVGTVFETGATQV